MAPAFSRQVRANALRSTTPLVTVKMQQRNSIDTQADSTRTELPAETGLVSGKNMLLNGCAAADISSRGLTRNHLLWTCHAAAPRFCYQFRNRFSCSDAVPRAERRHQRGEGGLVQTYSPKVLYR
jgi:hypothetical protein